MPCYNTDDSRPLTVSFAPLFVQKTKLMLFSAQALLHQKALAVISPSRGSNRAAIGQR